MSDNLDNIPLPEPCTIEDKLVSTRKNLVEEQDGNLFNRKCDNLDNTIPKRKDRFIECEELPEVPKVLLKNKQFNEVEFPGVPLAEIPKKLLAHLLPCCLEGRSAGFDFEIVQELNSQNKKPNIEDITQASTQQPGISQTPTVFPLSIQLGTSGYLLIGLSLKPELCFCDENCGDEDYIHIKVNLDAEYHDDDDDDVIQDPDLTITDEQLTKLISSHGGGGGGNPLCSRKMFAVYQGANSFIPWNGVSEIVDAPVSAELAPYLSNTTLVQNAVYKLEYFCEDDTWYVTDGACGTLVPTYTGRADRVTSAEGLAGSQWTGYFILDSPNAYDLRCEFEGDESTTTPAAAFENGISFSISPGPNNNPHHAIRYSFRLKEGASGGLVYYATVMDAVSCRSTTYRLVIRVKEIPLEEEIEEENESEEEEQQTNGNE